MLKTTILIALSLHIGIASAKPFKVGVILPLSGPVAENGTAVTNGLNLFLKDHPDSNFSFIYEDSRYESPTSISAFNKLVDSDMVDIVFSWGTTPSAVIASNAEFKKVPTIVMTGDREIIKGKKFSIDFRNDLETYSIAELNELRRRGYKKLMVVKTEIQFIETFIKGIEDNLNEHESLEVLDSFEPRMQVNYQATLTKLRLNSKKGNCDAVGVFLMSGQLSSFYKKIHDQKINIPSFGSDILDSDIERKESGESLIGAFWPSLAITKEFEGYYKTRYNDQSPIGFAAGAYDLANLLSDLFSEIYKDGKKLSPEEILERIESVKEREGASGKYYFTRDDPKHDPVGGKRFKFPLVIKEVTADGREKILTQ